MDYTPIARVTAIPKPAADRAMAYGLPGEVIDGNDVVLVRDTVAERRIAPVAARGRPFSR